MQNSNRIWAIGVGLVVLALIGIAIIQRPQMPASSPTTAATSGITTPVQTQGGVTGTGVFTVSSDNVAEIDIPDHRAAIKFSSDVSAEVRAAIQKSADVLKDRLAKDSFDLRSWIDLGTIRKMAGDYAGAETAWLFVTEASPQNPIAFNNLGDLYMNFLKDFPKAEAAYLAAIKIDPAGASAYRDLALLYDELYKKGSGAGEAILKKGVAAAPDSIDLHVLLARHYKAAGRTGEAKAEYDAAIAAAERTGQGPVAEQLKAERNQL